MSKVIAFPKAKRTVTLHPIEETERLLALFDNQRATLHRRWTREGRRPLHALRKVVVAIESPLLFDGDATRLWGFAISLLILVEAAQSTAVRLTRNSNKVLRNYIRGVRQLATRVERSARKR